MATTLKTRIPLPEGRPIWVPCLLLLLLAARGALGGQAPVTLRGQASTPSGPRVVTLDVRCSPGANGAVSLELVVPGALRPAGFDFDAVRGARRTRRPGAPHPPPGGGQDRLGGGHDARGGLVRRGDPGGVRLRRQPLLAGAGRPGPVRRRAGPGRAPGRGHLDAVRLPGRPGRDHRLLRPRRAPAARDRRARRRVPARRPGAGPASRSRSRREGRPGRSTAASCSSSPRARWTTPSSRASRCTSRTPPSRCSASTSRAGRPARPACSARRPTATRCSGSPGFLPASTRSRRSSTSTRPSAGPTATW